LSVPVQLNAQKDLSLKRPSLLSVEWDAKPYQLNSTYSNFLKRLQSI